MLNYVLLNIIGYACIFAIAYVSLQIFKETRSYKFRYVLLALASALLTGAISVLIFIYADSMRPMPSPLTVELYYWRLILVSVFFAVSNTVLAYLLSKYIFKQRYGWLPLKLTWLLTFLLILQPILPLLVQSWH